MNVPMRVANDINRTRPKQESSATNTTVTGFDQYRLDLETEKVTTHDFAQHQSRSTLTLADSPPD